MKGGAIGLGGVGQGESVGQPCYAKTTVTLTENVTHVLPSPM